MSEELKKKLFNYEEIPPETTWARIALALDEDINAQFPGRLYQAEVIPPAEIWNKIETGLGLDGQEQYAAKLYNVEVMPPVDAWQHISGTLDQETSLPMISPGKRIAPILRYAVAASLVGIVAFGVVKLLNQKTTDHGLAGKTLVPQNTSPNSIRPEANKNPDVQTVPTQGNNLPPEKTELVKINSISRKRLSTNQVDQTFQAPYMTQTPDLVNAVNAEAAPNFQQASLTGEVPGNCPLIADVDRYLNFMNPDGSLIRVSKKLADAVGCFYSNGSSDEYKQCQEQIKKWRDKISQSSLAPSADHFMDILDILKSVQDKEL